MASRAVETPGVSTGDDECDVLDTNEPCLSCVVPCIGTCVASRSSAADGEDDYKSEGWDSLLHVLSEFDNPVGSYSPSSDSEIREAGAGPGDETSRKRAENTRALLALYAQRKAEVCSLRGEIASSVQKAAEMQTALDDAKSELLRARKEAELLRRGRAAAEARNASLVAKVKDLIGSKRKRLPDFMEEKIRRIVSECEGKK